MKLMIFVILGTWLTWGFYGSIMSLKSARDKGVLTPVTKAVAYPWLLVFILMDVVYNIIIGTIIFLEPPKEWLFTARVSRLNDLRTWRGNLARFFCRHLLDPLDPDGRHCS